MVGSGVDDVRSKALSWLGRGVKQPREPINPGLGIFSIFRKRRRLSAAGEIDREINELWGR